jgi:hypothetical protein
MPSSGGHARRGLRPEHGLLTVSWIAALALLVLNDHVLKHAGVLPGWLTGKLSDFAGLYVAPALLASLLRVSTRTALAACHLAVGGSGGVDRSGVGRGLRHRSGHARRAR